MRSSSSAIGRWTLNVGRWTFPPLLGASGALFHLHRERGPLRLAIRFKAQRLKQVRRAIRRQRIVLFRLRVRRWWSASPGITENGSVLSVL